MEADRLVYVASFGFHVVLGAALFLIEVAPPDEIVAIELQTIERPKPKEEEPEPEPDPIPVQQAPVPKAAPPPAAAPPPPPTFGFVVGSASAGPGGVAVAMAAPAPVRSADRDLSAAPAARSAACPEDTKAKPLSMSHPTYTDEAREAAIEGKVRVQLTIDATGAVVDAQIVEGLGHGLDEAAIASLRASTYAPSTSCGKPTTSTITVGVRFAL